MLQKSISDYPGNQLFMESYLRLEQSGHVVTRVRQLFTSVLSSMTSQTAAAGGELTAVFAILFELRRMAAVENPGGLVET